MLNAFPLSIGNAVRLQIEPPIGLAGWRLLRRTDSSFAGVDDPGAYIVAAGTDDCALVDGHTAGLVNGQAYFYRAYFSADGVTFPAFSDATATPLATFTDLGPDILVVLRDRIFLGLEAEVAAGRLKPPSGTIPVTTAPYGMTDISMPCVSVHLDSVGPESRGVGDDFPDMQFVGDDWQEAGGWLAKWSINVVGASLNADERLSMRAALSRIIIANLEVLSDAGASLVEFSQRDDEDFSGENAPLYFTRGSFGCLAPAAAGGTAGPVIHVETTVIPTMEVTDAG